MNIIKYAAASWSLLFWPKFNTLRSDWAGVIRVVDNFTKVSWDFLTNVLIKHFMTKMHAYVKTHLLSLLL